MKTFHIHTHQRRLLADMLTPVSVYQKLRRQYPHTVLLESADYHAMQNSLSFIGCDPVASFRLDGGTITQALPDGTTETYPLASGKGAVEALRAFAGRFEAPDLGLPFAPNGLFGYLAYDAVQYFEDLDLKPQSPETAIPSVQYFVYRYVMVFNHFRNEVFLFEHEYGTPHQSPGGLDQLEFLIQTPRNATGQFAREGRESSNFSEEGIREVVRTCIKHCLRGDVFQVVPSRRFAHAFAGDDFQVYRALRSVNPSPYLFYFDFGDSTPRTSSPGRR